jgi:hypothetical protein
MCGRYEAGHKQKIAEAFHVRVMLDHFYFSPGTEAAPGSIQPVILGHSSIQTTERYLGSEQEIAVAVNDNLGL